MSTKLGNDRKTVECQLAKCLRDEVAKGPGRRALPLFAAFPARLASFV